MLLYGVVFRIGLVLWHYLSSHCYLLGIPRIWESMVCPSKYLHSILVEL